MGSLSRLLKNTTVLMAGNFATKGLSALFIVYLARYLEDIGFGQYNFALSFAAVFIIFSDLGLDALTIRNVAREPHRAGEYLESVGMLRLGLSLVTIAASLAAATAMGLEGHLILVILVAGLAYLFDKMSGLFYALFRAGEMMELEAGTQIVWKVIQTCLGLGAIYFGFSLLEIMLVLLVSSVIKAVMGFTLLTWLGIRPARGSLTQRGIARETAPFAAFEVGNAVYMQMAIIMLFLLLPESPQETGWFSAGLRVIMFVLLVPSAFDAAIYPLFSKLYEASARDMGFAFGKSVKFSLAVSVPAAVLLVILANEVAGIFGPVFVNTANVLRMMAVLLPLYTVNMLIKTALWSGDAQRQAAANIWAAAVVLVLASYFLITEFGYIGAAAALVIAESAFLALNYHSSRRKGFPMGRHLAKPVIAGLCMTGAYLAMEYGLDRMGRFHMAFMAILVYLLAMLLMGFLTRSDRALIWRAISRRRT